jgi:hypothetical protein
MVMAYEKNGAFAELMLAILPYLFFAYPRNCFPMTRITAS